MLCIQLDCPLCSSSEKSIIRFDSCQVFICQNCSLQYLNEQQDPDYYQRYHENFDLHTSRNDQLRDIQYSIHAEHIQSIISKGKILDVGCSSGELISRLVKNQNYELYGIDPDQKAIEQAKINYPSANFSSCYLTDFETNEKFDAFIFRGTFQYLGNHLQNAMKKINSISNSKTKILMYSIPNSDSILYHILGDKWHMFHKLEHTLIFNRNSILKLCELFNYKPIEISFPYLETPYSNVEEDYNSLINLIKKNETKSFPFWGNIMQIILEKIS